MYILIGTQISGTETPIPLSIVFLSVFCVVITSIPSSSKRWTQYGP
ncbi:hypothetical protein V512_014345 [Mesotoga sp. Brook.08.105.5.1]|nr:hypothetical protein V512_014345 [Mesotoga sp. Brook.08.105.5.1]RAO95506.1 hypothetical protein M388_06530 [Mesotoga sp. Brook.08.YT.4.2.5.4.]